MHCTSSPANLKLPHKRMGGAPRVFDLSHVALHSTKNDTWLVINGRVVDVTEFLEEHPGGEEVLLEAAGMDATKEFDAIGHSKAASDLLLKYQVGVLRGFEGTAVARDDETREESKAKAYVMTGSVIKEDKYIRSSHGAVELLVPLMVACFAFWYRYSAAMAGTAY